MTAGDAPRSLHSNSRFDRPYISILLAMWSSDRAEKDLILAAAVRDSHRF